MSIGVNSSCFVSLMPSSHICTWMVKWTKKLNRYAEIATFFVRSYKIIPKYLCSWIIFHSALYCCYKYSNLKCQNYILKKFHKE
jgi:hypothetical protein